jgi:hypothetical protein
MALIKCLECGRQISDKATVCVGCGAPVVNVPPSDSGPPQSQQKTEEKEAKYYILKQEHEEECGPFTLQFIREMLRRGQITEETLFATSGMADWEPISKIMTVDLKRGRTTFLIFSALVLVTGIVVILGNSWYDDYFSEENVKAREKAALKLDAYQAATNIICAKIAGIQKFWPVEKAQFKRDFSYCNLTITADALNASGGPVRRAYEIDLHAKVANGFEYHPPCQWELVRLREDGEELEFHLNGVDIDYSDIRKKLDSLK